MTRQLDSTLPEPLLESLCQNGLDALPQALTILLNLAMQSERVTDRVILYHSRSGYPCQSKKGSQTLASLKVAELNG